MSITMATIFDRDENSRTAMLKRVAPFLNMPPMTHTERREANINLLRKTFGDAADSPTMGYYRALPDTVLKSATDKALGLQRRLLTGGALGVGSFYAAAGSLAFGFQGAAAVLAVASAGLVRDALKTSRAQDKLKAQIFDFKP